MKHIDYVFISIYFMTHHIDFGIRVSFACTSPLCDFRTRTSTSKFEDVDPLTHFSRLYKLYLNLARIIPND